MLFKELIKDYNDFSNKIWTPIRKIYGNEEGFNSLNNTNYINKLYLIINGAYNEKTIIDSENIFIEKMKNYLSHILPSLWFHQILLNNKGLIRRLKDENKWGDTFSNTNSNSIMRDIKKEDNIKDVVGITNTSDQVTQKWDVIPDLTKNNGDFLIEKNFNLSNSSDLIQENYQLKQISTVLRNNLIDNFTKNIGKIIMNNNDLIIKNLSGLFVQWTSI